jgi:hypothetical protein
MHPIVLLAAAVILTCGGTASYSSPESKWLQPHRAILESDPAKVPFYPHRATTVGAEASPEAFDSAEVCAVCHGEIYAQWRSSVMSRSWDDPIYRGLLKMASEATDGAVDNFCTGCHSPIGLVTGQITSQVNRTLPEEEGEVAIPGVNCEACHNMSGHTGIDNGAYVLTINGEGRPTKFGPRRDAVSPYHETSYSELHTESRFCGTCHNVTHPFSSTAIERTYDEWQESPYSLTDVQCQDCHMPTYRGKSAIMGKSRDDVRSHYFTGGNASLLEYFGEAEAAERSRQMLRQAGRVEIVDSPTRVTAGDETTVRIRVHNTGAGHKLPTGFPEGRELWIDFKVEDANGDVIYRLGQVENGMTEPGTQNFKVHLGDREGKEVLVEVWNVARILRDNRILPRGYEEVAFRFPVPQDAEGPLRVSADLNYWPFPQALVDRILGSEKVMVEVTQVDRAEIDIALDPLGLVTGLQPETPD